MRGHDALIELRRRHRMCPGLVFVDLVAEPSPAAADWQHWATQAHIEVTDTESIRRLDLRFLVGVHVVASGFNPDRVHQLHEACKAAGAARVVSIVHQWQGEELRTLSTRDSLADTEHAEATHG